MLEFKHMRQSVRAIIIHDDKLCVMHRNKFGQEYYTLIGGGVDLGENQPQALFREVKEETGLEVSNPRLVVTETEDKFYGPQFVYLCDYLSGEPKLSPDADEARINELGKNTYTPMWLPLGKLPQVAFKSSQLQKALLEYLPKGFPAEPIVIS